MNRSVRTKRRNLDVCAAGLPRADAVLRSALFPVEGIENYLLRDRNLCLISWERPPEGALSVSRELFARERFVVLGGADVTGRFYGDPDESPGDVHLYCGLAEQHMRWFLAEATPIGVDPGDVLEVVFWLARFQSLSLSEFDAGLSVTDVLHLLDPFGSKGLKRMGETGLGFLSRGYHE